MTLYFRDVNVYIDLFELSRTSVSGHIGQQTGVSLDVRATLAGRSDENIGLMSGMSVRSRTSLHHFAAGKSAPLHF
jgi:hypothetical protein